MRITQEADYALRIVTSLARADAVCGAAELAEAEGVPARFAHKILRKLMQGGIVSSRAGAKGGYSLLKPSAQLTMLEIIELIDGPLELSKCADETYECSKNGQCKQQCLYHCIFHGISAEIARRLQRMTIAEIIDPNISDQEKLNKIT